MITKNRLRTRWWAAVIVYVVLLYSTLSIAPRWWQIGNEMLMGKGVFVLNFLYAYAATMIFFYLIYVKKENSLRKYFWFFFCIAAAWLLLQNTPLPAEKVHLAEYGILGVLLYNALKIDIDFLHPALYVSGSLVCVSLGAMDEVIQLFLPNRYFDWGDLFMNGASGVLVLCLMRLSILNDEL